MRFWDISAVVPLLVNESATTVVKQLFQADPEMIVWWGTRVECASALGRYAREQEVSGSHLESAQARLTRLAERWSEILATDALRAIAERIVRTHPLRAADALQLAAAVVASDGQPGGLPFASLDARQREAARREGFRVLPTDMPTSGVVREHPRKRGIPRAESPAR